MKISENFQIVVYIFVILTLTFLIFYVINDSKSYSCDQCSVYFRSRLPGRVDDKHSFIQLTANAIYESLQNNECLIKWDKANGFMKNG